MFASVCGMTANAQSQVVREDVAGIVNFAHIETTVACAGAITPESVAQIKEMGFGAIINLRRPSEEGDGLRSGRSTETVAPAVASKGAGWSV